MAAKAALHFAYEQARRFVRPRPWERLGQASLYLDLKAGSWHEVCAQHFTNSSATALFLFPGHQNLLDMQRRGLGEPPAGTIFVELLDDRVPPEGIAELREHCWPAELRPMPIFKNITPYRWQVLQPHQIQPIGLAPD